MGGPVATAPGRRRVRLHQQRAQPRPPPRAVELLGAWTAEWAFTVALGSSPTATAGRRPRPRGTAADAAVGAASPVLRRSPTGGGASASSSWSRRSAASSRGAAAVVAALDLAPVAIYALAVLSTIAATLFRPAHSALLPSLCHTGPRACERQRRTRHARLPRHPGRAARGGGAARGGRRRRGVRRRRGRVAVVGGTAPAPAGPGRTPRRGLPTSVRTPTLLREVVEGVGSRRPCRDLSLVLGLAAAQFPARVPSQPSRCWSRSSCSVGTGKPGAGTLMTAVGWVRWPVRSVA